MPASLRPASSSTSSVTLRPSTSSTCERTSILRVGIIGGGLGGLTLGQILHTASNVEATVYERSVDSIDRLFGYRVMISLFVLKKLHSLIRKDVWEKVVAGVGVQPEYGQELAFMKSDGQKMFAYDADEMRDTYSVSRWAMRKALLHDSEGFVRFGKTFQKYENMPNGKVKMYFADGTTAECDMLIGADGVGSRVRKQLVPEARITEPGLAVIYFKIPLTRATKELLPTDSGAMAFCPNNQNIILHSWMNPRKLFATLYDDFDISTEESFIMFGYGSPYSKFLNKTKPPNKLSSEELKFEVIARARSDPNMSPNIVALAEQCIVNTAYLQIVQECQAIKKWSSPSNNVTLIGDAVFNIATMLGKGANYAMLDATNLASTLILPRMLYPSMRRPELRALTQDNIKRRLRERQRNNLIQNLVYFGDGNRLKEFGRDKGLKMALGWIDDPRAKEFYSTKR